MRQLVQREFPRVRIEELLMEVDREDVLLDAIRHFEANP